MISSKQKVPEFNYPWVKNQIDLQIEAFKDFKKRTGFTVFNTYQDEYASQKIKATVKTVGSLLFVIFYSSLVDFYYIGPYIHNIISEIKFLVKSKAASARLVHKIFLDINTMMLDSMAFFNGFNRAIIKDDQKYLKDDAILNERMFLNLTGAGNSAEIMKMVRNHSGSIVYNELIKLNEEQKKKPKVKSDVKIREPKKLGDEVKLEKNDGSNNIFKFLSFKRATKRNLFLDKEINMKEYPEYQDMYLKSVEKLNNMENVSGVSDENKGKAKEENNIMEVFDFINNVTNGTNNNEANIKELEFWNAGENNENNNNGNKNEEIKLTFGFDFEGGDKKGESGNKKEDGKNLEDAFDFTDNKNNNKKDDKKENKPKDNNDKNKKELPSAKSNQNKPESKIPKIQTVNTSMNKGNKNQLIDFFDFSNNNNNSNNNSNQNANKNNNNKTEAFDFNKMNQANNNKNSNNTGFDFSKIGQTNNNKNSGFDFSKINQTNNNAQQNNNQKNNTTSNSNNNKTAQFNFSANFNNQNNQSKTNNPSNNTTTNQSNNNNNNNNKNNNNNNLNDLLSTFNFPKENTNTTTMTQFIPSFPNNNTNNSNNSNNNLNGFNFNNFNQPNQSDDFFSSGFSKSTTFNFSGFNNNLAFKKKEEEIFVDLKEKVVFCYKFTSGNNMVNAMGKGYLGLKTKGPTITNKDFSISFKTDKINDSNYIQNDFNKNMVKVDNLNYKIHFSFFKNSEPLLNYILNPNTLAENRILEPQIGGEKNELKYHFYYNQNVKKEILRIEICIAYKANLENPKMTTSDGVITINNNNTITVIYNKKIDEGKIDFPSNVNVFALVGKITITVHLNEDVISEMKVEIKDNNNQKVLKPKIETQISYDFS